MKSAREHFNMGKAVTVGELIIGNFDGMGDWYLTLWKQSYRSGRRRRSSEIYAGADDRDYYALAEAVEAMLKDVMDRGIVISYLEIKLKFDDLQVASTTLYLGAGNTDFATLVDYVYSEIKRLYSYSDRQHPWIYRG